VERNFRRARAPRAALPEISTVGWAYFRGGLQERPLGNTQSQVPPHNPIDRKGPGQAFAGPVLNEAAGGALLPASYAGSVYFSRLIVCLDSVPWVSWILIFTGDEVLRHYSVFFNLSFFFHFVQYFRKFRCEGLVSLVQVGV